VSIILNFQVSRKILRGIWKKECLSQVFVPWKNQQQNYKKLENIICYPPPLHQFPFNVAKKNIIMEDWWLIAEAELRWRYCAKNLNAMTAVWPHLPMKESSTDSTRVLMSYCCHDLPRPSAGVAKLYTAYGEFLSMKWNFILAGTFLCRPNSYQSLNGIYFKAMNPHSASWIISLVWALIQTRWPLCEA